MDTLVYLYKIAWAFCKNKEMKRFILYLIRWQLSTPILFLVINYLEIGYLEKVVIANLIGGLLFYQVDKKIIR
jgi:hypothetical protein